MPNYKKPLKEASIEDFKVNEERGISTPRYTIYLYTPKSWINNPTEGIGISANFINQETLKQMVFQSVGTSIEKVNKTNMLLRLEVAGSYLNTFYRLAKQLPEEAELKIRAKNESEETNE